MSKFTYCLMVSILALMLGSCEEEGMMRHPYHAVDIEMQGIDLKKSHKGLRWDGDIPAEGKTFVIKSVGEYASRWGFLGQIYVQYTDSEEIEYWNGYSNPPIAVGDTVEGAWGKMTYESVDPYTMKFEIAPNNEGRQRNLQFTIGGGYWYTEIYLTQPPVK